MSERTAFGAAQDTHGSRMNVSNDVTLSFIAATSCCWRRARVEVVLARVAEVLARAGQRERLRRPLSSVSPRLRRSVVPPLRRPPLISERTQPPL